MLDSKHFTIVAGQAVVEILRTEHADVVRRSAEAHPLLDTSNDMARHCEDVASRGYLGAEIVKTIYGWSLRYASGLQDFSIIMRGIKTLEAAKDAARDWVAEQPSLRYAYMRKTADQIEYCPRHDVMYDDICGTCEALEDGRSDRLADYNGMMSGPGI